MVSVVTLIGLVRIYTPVRAPIPDLAIAATTEQIERGEHLAASFCASCHSTTGDLPLTGGVDLGQDIPIPLGSFIGANLTPTGPLADWSDGEIFHAIRNGLRRDGRILGIMSTIQARNMSDEDLLAVIAYLRSQPPTGQPTPEPLDRPSLLAVLLTGAGMIPAGPPPTASAINAPPRGPTAEYGEYLLSYQDCRNCHGEDLNGGVPGQLTPIEPPLRHIRGWTQEQYITAMRTGTTPYTLTNQSFLWEVPWAAVWQWILH